MKDRITAIVLILVVLISGCNQEGNSVNANSIDAEGVYVRHLRLDVASEDVHLFESMMKRVVRAAETTKLPDTYDWLCYREQPNQYWILSFSDGPTNFACPPTLAGFAETIGKKEGKLAWDEIAEKLEALEYKPISEVVMQQNSKWSTVDEMTTRDHPKARIIVRSILDDKQDEFAAAVLEWTSYLKKNGYPLPIEGFVAHSGPGDSAWQVVFSSDWISFQQKYDFPAFINTLDEATQAEFARLEADLMSTVSHVSLYDGDHAPLLSFGAK